MKVLQLYASLDPAHGGPSASLRALIPAWTALGHKVEIVCLDRPGESFLSELPCIVHALGPVQPGFSYAPRLLPWLRENAPRFDAVLSHGLWQYPNYAVRKALRDRGAPPYFVYPHGMLDPWFRHQYPLKHFKKRIYWWLAERRVLRDAAAVLYTCEEEKKLAPLSFGPHGGRERVVAYGTVGPTGNPDRQRAAFRAKFPEIKGPFWLFLGRIHLKKGVDLLIDAYADLAHRRGAELPALVIAGPCADDSYLRELQSQASSRCPAGSVHWTGMLGGDNKAGALRAADVFILPSHQENFGIAVAEALSCGTPVLISDKVNIWREIEADGAGLVAPDDAKGTSDLLTRWLALGGNEQSAMRKAAEQSFQQRYEVGAAARSLAAVVEEALQQRSKS